MLQINVFILFDQFPAGFRFSWIIFKPSLKNFIFNVCTLRDFSQLLKFAIFFIDFYFMHFGDRFIHLIVVGPVMKEKKRCNSISCIHSQPNHWYRVWSQICPFTNNCLFGLTLISHNLYHRRFGGQRGAARQLNAQSQSAA